VPGPEARAAQLQPGRHGQAPAALAVRANIYKNHQRITPQALLLAAAGCWLLLAAAGCCWLLLAAAGCCWLLAAAGLLLGCCWTAAGLPLAAAGCLLLLLVAAGCCCLLLAAAGC